MADLSSLRPHAIVLGMLDEEIVNEKAANLGRLTRAFEARLADYRGLADDVAESDRRQAIRRLADALYHLVIHREALGLRDGERLMRDYQVPPAVRAYMGVSAPEPGS